MGYRADKIKERVLDLTNRGFSAAYIAKKVKRSEARISQILSEASRKKEGELPARTAPKPSSPMLIGGPGDQEVETLNALHDKLRDELDYITDVELPRAKGRERKEWVNALTRLTDQLRKVVESKIMLNDTLNKLREFENFKKVVLEEIANESQEVKQRIIDRLRSRRFVEEPNEPDGSTISGEGKSTERTDPEICGELEPRRVEDIQSSRTPVSEGTSSE